MYVSLVSFSIRENFKSHWNIVILQKQKILRNLQKQKQNKIKQNKNKQNKNSIHKKNLQ
jgi:hypothetical protein